MVVFLNELYGFVSYILRNTKSSIIRKRDCVREERVLLGKYEDIS